jgi:hypothetical protein
MVFTGFNQMFNDAYFYRSGGEQQAERGDGPKKLPQNNPLAGMKRSG